jgi:hypothetical protein
MLGSVSHALLHEAHVPVVIVPARMLGAAPAARAPHRLLRTGAAGRQGPCRGGSRGLGRFRAALGSVSHAVLHEADRPVVVVPHVPTATTKRGPEEGLELARRVRGVPPWV